MTARPGRSVAVIVTAVMAALAVAGVVIAVGSAAQDHGGVPWVEVTLGAVIVLYVVVGAVITSARPGHRVGWLLLGGALTWAIGEAALEGAIYGLLERPGTVPGAALLAVGGTTLRGLGWWLLVVLLPLVFPTGRLPGRRWHWVYPLAAVGVVGYLAVSLLSPWPADDRLTGVDNPIGLPQRWAAVIDGLGVATTLLFIAAVAAAVASLIWRWWHGDGLVRQQLLWFTVAAVAPLAVLVAVLAASAPAITFAVAVAPVPIVVGVAVLQHRLYDIHLAVNRTLVYLTLSAALVAMYLLVVAGVGALLDTAGAPWLSWLAAGVVAVSFAPLRQALQRAVNRLTYGRWDDPYGVLSGLARHLQVAADVPALIQRVVDELAGTLHLPYVQVSDAYGRLLAAYGRPGPTVLGVPLSAYGTTVGVMRYTPPSRLLRTSDRRLLDDLAGQLGTAVHAGGLITALQQARERLVLTREEERRRLRRDLHDGLGPALASLTLKAETTRNLMVSDPAAVDTALLKLRQGIQATVADVRRLVEGLRPPALDDLGLLGALSEAAQRLAADGDVEIAVQVPADLPPLSAAAEVAAYRICLEALTNTVRHANATSCTISVGAQSRGLRVTVADDGCGIRTPQGGNGLHTMRERAEELGGRLTVSSHRGKGTIVEAFLPITATSANQRNIRAEVAAQ